MISRRPKYRPDPARKAGQVAIFVLLAAFIAASGAFGGDRLPTLIQFSIQDEDGNFFYEGEIEFCTPDGECLFADINPGFPGHFFLPSAELKAGVPYTVFVYDPQVTVLFEMRDWIFEPKDYDPGYNRYWELNQFLIFPNFKAHPDRRMTFHLETALNPEWQVVSGLGFSDDDFDNLPDWPEFMATLQVPFMLGNRFTRDEGAAGGVSDLKPGVGISGTWRMGYPRVVPERDAMVRYRELTLAYHQNRYDTRGVYYPGRDSDVSFNRVTLSFGLGMMDQLMQNHWSLAAAFAFGGIYDGTEVLSYRGRDYSLYGFGIQARYIHEMIATERLNVGLTGQFEWMYYPAEKIDDNDFWFGSAPAAMIGLTVY
jgi:hypothetical protein